MYLPGSEVATLMHSCHHCLVSDFIDMLIRGVIDLEYSDLIAWMLNDSTTLKLYTVILLFEILIS
jgi:hypothetical protein